MWIHMNCDLEMDNFAYICSFLVPLRQAAHRRMATVNCADAAERGRGGRRWTITQISLVGITAVFMGANPSGVATSLSGTLRSLNSFLPGHTDPDAKWTVSNTYIRGLRSGQEEREGCRLYIADGRTGGQVVEIRTDPLHPLCVIQVDFCPTKALHWVESAPGTEGNVDDGFVRDIPFDNSWLTGVLLGGRPVGIRLAPREPLPREPIRCTVCGLHVGCPAQNPVHWVNHFGAAVQRAIGLPAFSCYDCMRAQMEQYWSPVFT